MEDETQISYLAIKVGMPVECAEGHTFGKVEHILQDPQLDLFDGVVVSTHHGLRFVAQDQIREITTHAIRCTLSDAEAAQLPRPDGPNVFHVDGLQDVGPSLSAHLGRIFRREHWIEEK